MIQLQPKGYLMSVALLAALCSVRSAGPAATGGRLHPRSTPARSTSLGPAGNSARGRSFEPYLTLYSENDTPSGTINSGKTMAYSAVLRDQLENVLPGETITFSASAQHGAAPTLNPTVTQTSQCGQAVTQVTSTGPGSGVITAAYIDVARGQIFTTTATYGTSSDGCKSNSGYDPPIGYPIFTHPCSLIWASTSQYDTANAAGVAVWNLSGWAYYTKGSPSNCDVLFKDSCTTSNNWFAWTNDIGGDKRTITWNTSRMDPCPISDCPNDFPPASARNCLTWIATHELGHAMGLDHSFPQYRNDRGALMWPDTSSWFICGTNALQPDEVNGLGNLGYSMCL